MVINACILIKNRVDDGENVDLDLWVAMLEGRGQQLHHLLWRGRLAHQCCHNIHGQFPNLHSDDVMICTIWINMKSNSKRIVCTGPSNFGVKLHVTND
jgi:hypothetical protein